MSKGENPKRRVPQQDRGERRVAEVLEAASSVIAEVGYEAATMTEIAERAGASIGALYQYFPNKDAIVLALRRQFGDEMEARWKPLMGQSAKLSVKDLVDRILEVIVDFMENRPAYLPLQSAPRNNKYGPTAKHRLRSHFAAVFREKQQEMTSEEALRVASVTVQIIRGMGPLFADAKAGDRKQIVSEFRLLLTSYLGARLRG
jgi:AcrR family transcriptional regulator